MRCNLNFHQHERYDCVVVNSDTQHLVAARFRALLRCMHPTGRTFDVSYVRLFREHRWRPATNWDGCEVFEEPVNSVFLPMDSVVRGTLLSPVFDQKVKGLYYASDSVDPDMFWCWAVARYMSSPQTRKNTRQLNVTISVCNCGWSEFETECVLSDAHAQLQAYFLLIFAFKRHGPIIRGFIGCMAVRRRCMDRGFPPRLKCPRR